MKLFRLNFIIILIISFSLFAYARDYKVNIIGNKYIDQEIVLSLISNLSDTIENIDKSKIIEDLNDTGYFENIEVFLEEGSLNIKLNEYPIFKEIHFSKNKRFKEEDLLKIFQKNNQYNIFNEYNISKTIDDYNNLYKSFGYNSINIDYEIKKNESEEVEIFFNFNEGKISKIRNITFNGNSSFSKGQLLNQIKSRERNYLNFISNINFKINVLNDDVIRLINFYQNNGFRNVKVNFISEYITKRNYFDVYFNIDEGSRYYIDKIDVNANSEYFSQKQIENIQNFVDIEFEKKFKSKNLIYDENFLVDIKKNISDYIFNEGLYFFQISLLEKVENDQVSILYDINNVEPNYVKEINIVGNTRTKDKVIRRELEFAEGDALNDIVLEKSRENINSIGIFASSEIEKKDDGSVLVTVKERSTGSFQVGLGFNSYEGATFIARLDENNFQGSGRKVNFTFNNADDKSEYRIGLIEPYIFNKNLNLIYNIEYRQINLSDQSSYNYDDFNTEVGLNYYIYEDLIHKTSFGYSITDYEITDKNNVSDSILNLSGSNAKFLINNSLTYNKLDSIIKPTTGNYFRFTNVLSPVTNSTDGYTKNTINVRQYLSGTNNIYSFQGMIGSIVSFQNETIDNNDKFALGGKWLRGFDNYGAGPRDSSTSYIGGNNVTALKLDLLRPLDKFSDNPIYINLFADAGKVWSNKNTPTYNNESIRSSYGFGFNYYSPIGPIGFSWGFPLTDEPEDIKRMFTFSIGYLN